MALVGKHSASATRAGHRAGGCTVGPPPAFIALCHFRFESLADFQDAFGAHAQELQGDIPNYTDVEPVIQISEVAVSR